MTRCQDGLSVLIILPISTCQITITTDDLLCLRIPYNQLFIAVLTDIKLIDIHLFSRSSTSFTKSDFTQSSNLLHHIWCIMCRDDIDFIMTLIGHTELAIGYQLALEDFFVDGFDDFLFHGGGGLGFFMR